MAISDKKALDCAKTLITFCDEQPGCQNCAFRKYGCDSWKCHINAFPFDLKYALEDVEANIEAKKKNHGFL